ncbi:hypothetical protein GGR27_001081 [Lewinella antarctica]|uniref:Uncharacterized protein n=1 Tax=Neolewinella antarctica TaxID=442734 RepID=A0ABX0X8M3_9BACT|nr:hypothetical protein [Neolewinella antarctica]
MVYDNLLSPPHLIHPVSNKLPWHLRPRQNFLKCPQRTVPLNNHHDFVGQVLIPSIVYSGQ